MSDPAAKTGPLTQADLQAIWDGAVDKSYSQPFEFVGEGHGFEAYTQMFAQFARVAQAIDISTQAMFIRAWSGQSNPPAAGAQLATVQLTFTRTKFFDRPLRIGAGLVFFEEQQTDWGTDGPVTVLTGRRYTLQQDLVFLPGESGPFTVTAQAEKPGYGYNNPRPNTIVAIVQNGSGFNNTLGTVTEVAGSFPPPPPTTGTLIAANMADMFIPDHVGQYVFLSAGANAGVIARAVAFVPPVPLGIPPQGSGVVLEHLDAIESFAGIAGGPFAPNEPIQIKSGVTVVGLGQFVVSRATGVSTHVRIAFVITAGVLAKGDTLLGTLSGATATVDMVLSNIVLTPEHPTLGVGGASWVVLDWASDLGLSVTNPQQPTGGKAAFLDELGLERNIPRAPGESDLVYSKRISEIADVVTPNAVRRALNRISSTTAWCFREVGSALLPGFYYDRTLDPAGDFYDFDTFVLTGVVSFGSFLNPATQFQERLEFRDSSNNVKASGYFGRLDAGTTLFFIRKSGQGTITNPVTVNAGDYVIGLSSGAKFAPAAVTPTPSVVATRFHVYLDYIDMRAFFLIGVPRSDAGDPGFAYDAGPHDAYDASPFLAFYDGKPFTAAQFDLQVHQTIDRIRAGGVSFDLYIEDDGCT